MWYKIGQKAIVFTEFRCLSWKLLSSSFFIYHLREGQEKQRSCLEMLVEMEGHAFSSAILSLFYR